MRRPLLKRRAFAGVKFDFAGQNAPGLDLLTAAVRTTLGTAYDSAGNVVWWPQNLLWWSNDITQSTWNKTNGGSVTTGIADPFGGTTACRWAVGAVGGSGLQFDYTMPASVVTLSGWFRIPSGTRNFLLNPNFDSGQSLALTTTWQFLSVTLTGQFAGSAGQVRIDRAATNGLQIEVFQLQLNAGTSTKYYPTTSAAYFGARLTYDPATHAAWGYLYEASSQNLCQYSTNLAGSGWSAPVGSVTVTSNYATAPDGTTTATRIQFPSNLNTNQYCYNYTHTAGVHTQSLWMRVPSGTAVLKFGFFDGAGVKTDAITLTATWQRFVITKTLVVGGNRSLWFYPEGDANAQDIQAWGGQIEPGGVATSLIPTNGSTVTRTTDSYPITGSLFTKYFAPCLQKGTMVLHVRKTGSTTGVEALFAFSAVAGYALGRGMLVRTNGISSIEFGGNGSASSVPGAFRTDGSLNKVAFSWDVASTTMKCSVNGSAVVTLATLDFTGVGTDLAIFGSLNISPLQQTIQAYIAADQLYPYVRNDLQALST